MSRREEWIIPSAIIAIGLSISIGIWVLSSYNEARVYSRLTGADVSTWDAMWIELRVQEQAND